MKTIQILVVLLTSLLASVTVATGVAGSRAARMNVGTGLTLTGDGVEAINRTAKGQPALAMMLDSTLGQDWANNVEIVDSWTVPAGTRFINSGTDRHGVPCQWEQKAKESFICVRLRNRLTMKTVLVKDNCLNPVNRVPGVPKSKRELVEAAKPTDVDFDLSTEVDIVFSPVVTATATATASTAPITITINNVTNAAPLMMAGSQPANQYVVVRDQRGFLNLGWLSGGGTKIKIVNNNLNFNENINSNSNANSNANSINISGG